MWFARRMYRRKNLLPVGTIVRVSQEFLDSDGAKCAGFDANTRGIVEEGTFDLSGAMIRVRVLGGGVSERIPSFWEAVNTLPQVESQAPVISQEASRDGGPGTTNEPAPAGGV